MNIQIWLRGGGMLKKIILIIAATFSVISHATQIETTTRSFSSFLGTTRIVFDSDTDSYNLPVDNRLDYPVLVETKIMDESSEKTSSKYIATPPLFRLDGGQKNTVSIIKVSDDFAKDVESMNWVCVKNIPPSDGSAWASNDINHEKGVLNINIMVNNCIKLIMRPASLENIKDASYGDKLKWSIDSGKLTVENPTPYYINFSEIKLNGKNITPPVFVKPKSSYAFEDLKQAKQTGNITWQLLNDFGAKTHEFQSTVSQ